MDSKTDSKLGHLGAQWIAEIIGDVKKRRDNMQNHLALLKNEGNYKQAHVDALAVLNAMLSAAAPQVVADELGMQTIRERDFNAEMADKLADGIAEHFGVDIGEHSSANCPWVQAMDLLNTKPEFIDCAGSKRAAAPVQAQEPVLVQAFEESGNDRESGAWFDIAASEAKSYTDEGYKVRKLFTAPVQPVAVPDSGIEDWLGHALELESLTNRVESQTVLRAMESAAQCLRLMGKRFAAPAAQGDAKDAERYRFLSENIQEGYELPGGFYLADHDTSTWDGTIDAAIAAKAAS